MRQFITSTLLGTAAMGLALSVTPAAAQDIGALYTFGDSLADPGNLSAVQFNAQRPGTARFYSNRRFSNGGVIPE